MFIPALVQYVDPPGFIPKGYGLAYRCWNRDGGIFLPIPLNLIVRGIHVVYYALARAWYPNRWERIINTAREYAFEGGRESRQHEIEVLKIKLEVTESLLLRTQRDN